MTRIERLLCTLIVFIVSTGAFAQRFGEAVEVRVVEVPVTVVDRAGNPVADLTKESFELYDDGKRVPIEYFERLDLTEVTKNPERPLPPAAYRNFLLLFDFANATPVSIDRAQAAARSFVSSELTERDLVAVGTYSAANGLQLLTSFTRDRQLVDAALGAVTADAAFRIADPLLLAGGLPGDLKQTSVAVGERAGMDTAYRALIQQFDRMSTRVNDQELRGRIRKQLSDFTELARTLDRLRGQKQVILLSEGFDPRLVIGRTDLAQQSNESDNAAIASGEIWKVDSDQYFGSATSAGEISDMAQLFRRSDVLLHAVDIKGVRSDVDPRAGLQKASNEALHLVTKPTGGSVFQNGNDLGESMRDLLRRQQVIYLLGFRSTPTGKRDKFHNLKVKTNVRGVEVSHRQGYFEATSGRNEVERTLSLAEILVTDAPATDVSISAFATAVPGSAENARVPVVVEFRGTDLLARVAGPNATAHIYVYAFDEQDRVHDFLQQRVTLELAKTRETLERTGVRYIGALRLPAGRYALKTLVRVEETGSTGFLRTEIDVPTFGDNTVLQPVAIGDMTNWITLLNPARTQDVSSLLTIAGEPFVPRIRTRLTPSSEQRVALMVYRTALTDLGISPTIVARDGSTSNANISLVGRTPPDAAGVTKVVFNFKPEGLRQGDYDLRFTVTPKGSGPSTVLLPFTIE